MWKYFLLWFPMVLIAIANGAFREAVLRKRFGELQAHQISTVLLMLLFAAYAWTVGRIWPSESPGRALTVGFLWLGLTLAFEFLFGRYVAGRPWSTLLQDYNVLAGRVWILIPLWITVAPYLFYRLRQR